MSLSPLSPRDALAADAKSLNALKFQSGQQSPTAIKEAAKQLESLFMRELIKSMREATMKSGMLQSPQGDLGQDLLDQQMAVQMSGRPGGLSDLIARQLTQQSAPVPHINPTSEPPVSRFNSTPASPTATLDLSKKAPAQQRQSQFVQQHDAVARRVEQQSGIPAGFMLGQAGHETGWGQREIKMADGSPAFNLFGIKAGANWRGKVAEVTTTEYVDGVPRKTTARFRAYASYEASFKDYARLIEQSPRYAGARQQTSSAYAYASGLQQAGYATDPNYATKLSRAINSALNIQRAMG